MDIPTTYQDSETSWGPDPKDSMPRSPTFYSPLARPTIPPTCTQPEDVFDGVVSTIFVDTIKASVATLLDVVIGEVYGVTEGFLHELKVAIYINEKLKEIRHPGFYNIFVYTDIISYQRVGDSCVPLLRTVHIDGKDGDIVTVTYDKPHYVPERIIERLKEQRAREDNERIGEVESYKKENKDLKDKVNTLHMELTEKESCLIDLKEHASSLASSSLKKESKLKSLEMAIEQKKEECSKLETQLQKQAEQLFTQMNNPKAHEVQQQQVGVGSRGNPEYVEREQRVKVLEKEVSYYKEESGKAQAEVDRLLAILREVETEKNDRDKKIAELESLAPRQTKEQVTKKGGPNLKLGPQGEKKPGQIMGDPRKDNTMDLGQHLKLEEMMNTLERTRQELDATKQRLSSTQQSLQERDGHLTNMRQERRKQLEEILEMKQQALLAAISEKDANIALLELSASGKKKTQEEVLALKREKDRLMHQLKQQVRTGDTTQTQSRMKLMADSYEDDHYHPHPPFHSLPQQPHLGLQPQSPQPQPQYQHPPHSQQQHATYPHAPHPQTPPQQHPHPQQPQQQYSPHPQQHPQGHPQQPQHQPRPQHPLQVQQPHPQQQQHPHPGQHPHGPPPQQQHPHPQQHPQPHLHGPLQQAPHPHHPHPQHPQQHPHHPHTPCPATARRPPPPPAPTPPWRTRACQRTPPCRPPPLPRPG
nr:ERC protein 2-like [Oncorhynchus nerka]